ncbi:rad18p [Saccharomyces arboricola H-6]|uniref:Postreplication repair E3 ubiquitin-protein ligase RAD18 n=1 Tax=Saccharomyces arboricola (strain H-6 / AS 2.3317 / CBS 10644) TaxID=1160507 RepID=J8Q462_SACAR|nr:rad18p [Saccharomyces arboricola H-6]
MDHQITTASDFRTTSIPHLYQLDTLLRCHICKDFLKVPVLTPCGHTFCSLCIREHLNNQPNCPLCLFEFRESLLRSEFLVNEIIQSYTSIRPSLLNALKIEKPLTNSNSCKIPITQDSSLIELISESENDSSNTADDDLQIVATSERKPAKRSMTDILPLSSKSSKRSFAMFRSERIKKKSKPNEQMAQCPICQQFYPLKALEKTHLDECLTLQSLGKKPKSPKTFIAGPKLHDKEATKPKPQTSEVDKRPSDETSHVDNYLNSMANMEQQRLPKVNFTSMNQSQIKQKLLSLGLPTNGTRQNLIKRYNHYEMLWNSNFCDSLEPVDEGELKRQLLSWDVSHNKLPQNANNNGGISKLMMMKSSGKSSYRNLLENFKNDKFDRKGWIIMFQRDFARLIKEAKEKIKKGLPKDPDLTNQTIKNDEENGDAHVQNGEEANKLQMEEKREIFINEKQGINETSSPNEDLTDADLSRELMDMNEDGKDPPGKD